MELEFLAPGAIVAGVLAQFLPVWIGMAAIMGASFVFRRRLGTYGRIFDSRHRHGRLRRWCSSGC